MSLSSSAEAAAAEEQDNHGSLSRPIQIDSSDEEAASAAQADDSDAPVHALLIPMQMYSEEEEAASSEDDDPDATTPVHALLLQASDDDEPPPADSQGMPMEIDREETASAAVCVVVLPDATTPVHALLLQASDDEEEKSPADSQQGTMKTATAVLDADDHPAGVNPLEKEGTTAASITGTTTTSTAPVAASTTCDDSTAARSEQTKYLPPATAAADTTAATPHLSLKEAPPHTAVTTTTKEGTIATTVTTTTTNKERMAATTTAAPKSGMTTCVQITINRAAARPVQVHQMRASRPLPRRPPPPRAPPPPPPRAPPPPPPRAAAAFCAGEWDHGWSDQFNYRKRRKVVTALLPPHTIGRVLDPIRLSKTGCRCRTVAGTAGVSSPQTGLCLTHVCPCHARGLHCTESCQCCGSRSCRNNQRHAAERHASIYALVREGGGSTEASCCPCNKGSCSTKTCPCVLRGQHCRHRVNSNTPCKNPWGCEQPWNNFSRENSRPLLALAYFTSDQPASNHAAPVPPPRRRPRTESAESSSLTVVEQAWDEAHVQADAAFADQHAKARSVLEPLVQFAKEAHIEAQTQLKLNQGDKWWYNKSVPVAALPTKASPGEDALVCREAYPSLAVEEETDGKDRLDDIVQATQETMVLRYAATFLREKALELAQKRLAASKGQLPT